MNFKQYFECKKRDNGKEFYCLKDDSPRILKSLVRDIHTDCFYECMPNDWIYEIIREAFYELETHAYDDCYIEADIWDSDLLRWFSENGNSYAIEYVNEYMKDFPQCTDVLKYIRMGQWLAKDRIYQNVSEFIESHKENTND